MKKISIFLMAVVMLLMLCSCGNEATEPDMVFSTGNSLEETDTTGETEMNNLEDNHLAQLWKMMAICLSKHYSTPTDAHFCIFRVKVTEAYIMTDEGKEFLI